MKEDFKKPFLTKCPICEREYDSHWKVVNHIRKTKDKNHIDLLSRDEFEIINLYRQNKNVKRENIHNIIYSLNKINIFLGISYEKIMLFVSKHFSKDEMNSFKNSKISKTMKTLVKTDEHNKNVSNSVSRAWKDGKFHTIKNIEARRKGIEGRRSFSGSGNPMYGKASPVGSGRGRGGFRDDIGHYVRSTWEANFCRILKLNNREYNFEGNRFFIRINDKDMSYCPDILIKKNNKYYEIKGHAKSSTNWICNCENCQKGKSSIKELKKMGIKVVIIGEREYNLLKRHFKDKIKWEK